MEKKDRQLLTELVMGRGRSNLGMFGFDKQEREEFFRRYGLWDKVQEADKMRDKASYSFEIPERKDAEEKARILEMQVAREAREQLKKEGIDLDPLFGPDRSWEELREEIASQLEAIGIDREAAGRMGMLDEDAITMGVDYRLAVDDTPERRKALQKEGLEFTAEDGKIYLDTVVRAQKGMFMDDTPGNRHKLDELEMEYIILSQGKNLQRKHGALFVPFNWLNHLENNTVNTRFAQKVEQLALVAGMGLIGGAGIGLLAFLVIKNTRLRETLFRKHDLNLGQRQAIERGLTAYNKVRDRYGNERGVFYYQHDGKLYSVAAENVRIPSQVRGVRLTPLQQEQLRQGELVMLQDKDGKEFGVRVDLAKTDGIREYYREMKSDREMKPKIGPEATDHEKLEWISRFGAVGVNDIYGPSRKNLDRDAFLSRYGLKNAFLTWSFNEQQSRDGATDGQRKSAATDMDAADREIRDTAYAEFDKLNRSRGL